MAGEFGRRVVSLTLSLGLLCAPIVAQAAPLAYELGTEAYMGFSLANALCGFAFIAFLALAWINRKHQPQRRQYLVALFLTVVASVVLNNLVAASAHLNLWQLVRAYPAQTVSLSVLNPAEKFAVIPDDPSKYYGMATSCKADGSPLLLRAASLSDLEEGYVTLFFIDHDIIVASQRFPARKFSVNIPEAAGACRETKTAVLEINANHVTLALKK